MKKETLILIFGVLALCGGYMGLQRFYAHRTSAEHVAVDPADASKNGNQALLAENPLPTFPEWLSETTIFNSESKENPKIETPYATLEFTQKGGCLGKNTLAREHVSYNRDTPVSVVGNYQLCKAFGVRVDGQDLRTSDAIVEKSSPETVQIAQRMASIAVVRTFAFTEKTDYTGKLWIAVKNLSSEPRTTHVDLELGATSDQKGAGGFFSLAPAQYHSAALRLADGTIKRELTPFDSSPNRKILLTAENILPSWVTVDSLYWMNAVMPEFHLPVSFELVRTGFNVMKNASSEIDQTVYEGWLKHELTLQPGQIQLLAYKVYLGPKNENILKHFQKEALPDSIDYGFFKIVARPLYYALEFLHDVAKNWGLAIILLTIGVNIIFLPLQIKGYISAQKMQKIQPELKELQKKYKEDKPTLQKESMVLMAKHGINPLSGCLPLLPQIPVFFGLNSALQHTFDLRQAPFFLWIHDLTLPDPYFILPIIMAGLMIGYQKMMPLPSMDPTQAKMMKFLPIMFSLFMVVYPTGLALYVITNTVFSMARQAVLMRHLKK